MKRARDDEKHVQRLVEKAKAGDTKAAWTLIFELVDALDTGSGALPLFKFAADFFDELIQIRSQSGHKDATRATFGRAFDKLHILHRGRGRPQLDDLEIVSRFAAEDMIRRSGKSADDARAVLEAIGVAAANTMRDLRTDRRDLARLAKDLTDAERAALAEPLLARRKRK